MNPLSLLRVSVSMERTQGRPQIAIALIDGLVAVDRPDPASTTIHALPGRELSGKPKGACSLAESVTCTHGRFVAGMLTARRGSAAPFVTGATALLCRSSRQCRPGQAGSDPSRHATAGNHRPTRP